jgi:hypothetical protein
MHPIRFSSCLFIPTIVCELWSQVHPTKDEKYRIKVAWYEQWSGFSKSKRNQFTKSLRTHYPPLLDDELVLYEKDSYGSDVPVSSVLKRCQVSQFLTLINRKFKVFFSTRVRDFFFYILTLINRKFMVFFLTRVRDFFLSYLNLDQSEINGFLYRSFNLLQTRTSNPFLTTPTTATIQCTSADFRVT